MNEQTIFIAALEHDPPGRRAYLQEACGGDNELRRRVERLLSAHENVAQQFLEQPAGELRRTAAYEPSPAVGTQIGPYQLLQQIGEGGMGAVYLAEQTHPVQRKVALKLIKPGSDSRQVIARFEAERQALALMDHPHIAKVFDAGTTEAGQPYFVMELVHGVPITRYCDEHRLTPRQRLELFVPVCQAIQHAHQKGIIHRDIKPSNVLIAQYDGKPVPKVIDFGVAKATGSKLTEKTMFTEFGSIVGTLEYMSPEQADRNQLDVDTRSDIYSLGVLLYELLTGSTPLDKQHLRGAAILELLRIIKEDEPQKPSTRLSTTDELPSIAANRSLEPKKLSGLLRGDLDWIVMKALDKDRDRRYETANGFAMDVQRYLADEPVLACPPSTAYRLRKFTRRNKRLLLSLALVALALVAGTVVSTWQAVRATKAEGLAQSRLEAEKNARVETDEARKKTEKERDRAVRAEGNAQTEAAKANEQELLARRRLYASQMNLAQQAWEMGQSARVMHLLDGQIPISNQQDLRSFEWYYLWRLCQQKDVLTLRGGQSSVVAVAFTPDGKTFATGAEDGFVTLWDRVTGRQRMSFWTHPQAVNAVAFFPDGKTLATASRDRTARLWEVATGRPAGLFKGHTQGVSSVAISPDGTTLATGSIDQTAKLWDVETRQERLTLPIPEGAHSTGVNSVAFAPDGSILATGSGAVFGEGQVKLWDAATGTERASLKGHKDRVYAIEFSPDGKTLATGSFDTTVRLWDLVTWKEMAVLRGHTSSILGVAFAPDSRTLASAGSDSTVKLWSLSTAQEQSTLKGHLGPVRSVAFAPDGKTVGTGSSDGTAKLWDPARKSDSPSVKGHNGEVRSLAFSPDSRTFATVSFIDKTVKLWDVALGQEQRTFGDSGFHAVAYSPDRKTLAAAGGTVKVWDLISGLERSSLAGHAGGTWSLAFSPDGRLMATGGQDQTARLWDPITGQEQAILQGHTGNVQHVAFSPDGKALATGSWDTTVKLWSVSTGKELATLTGHMEKVTSVAFSPDGKTLASGGYDGITKLWDATTGLERFSLSGHTRAVWSVAFTSDGRTLATAAWDGTVRFWDPITGQERMTLRADDQPLWCVAFSRDGKTLAAAGRHGIINLWRAAGNDETEHSPIWADRAPAARLKPDDASLHNNQAWLLATSPDQKLRDAARAVELAKSSVELEPNQGMYWNTLGVAHYRAGDWMAAIASLEKSAELRKGGDGFDCFFLAMAHWQLDQKDEARQWYDRAIEWMEQNKPQAEELQRFRAEAENLLGVKQQKEQ